MKLNICKIRSSEGKKTSRKLSFLTYLSLPTSFHNQGFPCLIRNLQFEWTYAKIIPKIKVNYKPVSTIWVVSFRCVWRNEEFFHFHWNSKFYVQGVLNQISIWFLSKTMESYYSHVKYLCSWNWIQPNLFKLNDMELKKTYFGKHWGFKLYRNYVNSASNTRKCTLPTELILINAETPTIFVHYI